MEGQPHPHRPPNASLGNTPVPEATPTRYGFNPGETQGDGSHRLHRSPWGQFPFPGVLLGEGEGGRLAPTQLPLPARNGDPDPGAAPAPFPQRGSQAETLNPDKPV